ncbi:hypothetical protein AWC18_04170 [Mycolicibacter nonchromogenicus]|uniref:Uncharacterized protein n=1 Tax=Mycolicibacter nonchromogenicus TaxID=1782 RepID=A0A1X1ZJY8_MYCNO|nr:hypothetical protein [Mycolicibacter nonchromogenicus]ORW23673.1 hypothetical protein AWC18_04170 [Mycolicibacter nonchromogenicus]
MSTTVQIFDKAAEHLPIICPTDQIAQTLLAGPWFPESPTEVVNAIHELQRLVVTTLGAGGKIADPWVEAERFLGVTVIPVVPSPAVFRFSLNAAAEHVCRALEDAGDAGGAIPDEVTAPVRISLSDAVGHLREAERLLNHALEGS